MVERLIQHSVFLVFIGVIGIPLFWNLDALPLRVFDEARAAVNAQEMLENHEWLVPHFGGEPDMWASKPPLLIWLQSALINMIGDSEWAVRLPSAVAGFFTCLLLYFFSVQHLKKPQLGFLSALVLITIQGYVTIHSTRTGDYDSLLTLFTTLSGLSLFVYSEERSDKYLLLCILFTALAVLTKGIAGLLFTPAFVMYLLVRKQLINTLRKPAFYYGIVSFIGPPLGYYFLREVYNPGYLEAIRENELGGRFLETLGHHNEPFFFYYQRMANDFLKPWVVWVLIGTVIGLLHSNMRIKRMAIFSVLMIACFSLVISSAQTKLPWYPVPMYPFFAFLASITVFQLFSLIKESDFINRFFRWNFMPFLVLFVLFYHPYRWVIKPIINPQEKYWDVEYYSLAYYLRQIPEDDLQLNGCFLVQNDYDAHNQFYLNKLKKQGVAITRKNKTELKQDDLILAYQIEVMDYLQKNYVLEKLNEDEGVSKFKVLSVVN